MWNSIWATVKLQPLFCDIESLWSLFGSTGKKSPRNGCTVVFKICHWTHVSRRTLCATMPCNGGLHAGLFEDVLQEGGEDEHLGLMQ